MSPPAHDDLATLWARLLEAVGRAVIAKDVEPAPVRDFLDDRRGRTWLRRAAGAPGPEDRPGDGGGPRHRHHRHRRRFQPERSPGRCDKEVEVVEEAEAVEQEAEEAFKEGATLLLCLEVCLRR